MGVTAVLILLTRENGSTARTSDPVNDLHQAVIRGEMENVRKLVKHYPSSVNAKNTRGETALFVATKIGNIEMVDFLLQAGADLESENKFGLTPLFASIESNNAEMAKYLINSGANVNHSSVFFGTPLHRASFYNNSDIAFALLQHGGIKEARNRTQKTPLHEAARMGAVECTKLLLENNADVNATDITGKTPLHLSIVSGTNLYDQNCSESIATLLVRHGADPSAVDSSNSTPLVYAVDNGFLNICKDLLENGSDPMVTVPGASRTLLHVASIKGYTKISNMLLQFHVDPELKDAFGSTALQYAMEHGNEEIIRMLSTTPADTMNAECGKKYLKKALNGREAYVWKMNHRGWAVKTRDYLIIFDYEGNGIPPEKPSLSNGWPNAEEIRDEKVMVCYSAYHARPGNIDQLHSLEGLIPDMTFFHYKKDAWKGGDHTKLLDGTDSYLMGDLELDTYETSDSYGMGSLGYRIKVNGASVFYSNFIPEDKEAFVESLGNLDAPEEGTTIAFIDIPPTNDIFFSRYIIERFKPRSVILYSRQNDQKAVDEHTRKLLQEMPGLQVGSFNDPGDRMYFSGENFIKNQ